VKTIEEIRVWQAQERARARSKLLAEGMPSETVDMLLNEAQDMHEAQVECVARAVGESPPVVVH
jgi:hypothetical protein